MAGGMVEDGPKGLDEELLLLAEKHPDKIEMEASNINNLSIAASHPL